MYRILEFCHKSPENFKLVKGNSKWLGLPELSVISDCPTRWNSFLKCGERMIKIYDPLNATLMQAGKEDLVLNGSELELLKDLIH